jgi:hypothetical protein
MPVPIIGFACQGQKRRETILLLSNVILFSYILPTSFEDLINNIYILIYKIMNVLQTSNFCYSWGFSLGIIFLISNKITAYINKILRYHFK